MIKPLRDKVLIKILRDEPRAGSLLLSRPLNAGAVRAEVLEKGNGEISDGVLFPLEVKIGDIVLVNQHVGTNILSENPQEELIIVHEKQILGIFECS